MVLLCRINSVIVKPSSYQFSKMLYLRPRGCISSQICRRRLMQRISSNRTLISTSEATRIAGLSREHIQRLLRSSVVEGLKLGHDWLVYEDSLKAYLASSALFLCSSLAGNHGNGRWILKQNGTFSGTIRIHTIKGGNPET